MRRSTALFKRSCLAARYPKTREAADRSFYVQPDECQRASMQVHAFLSPCCLVQSDMHNRMYGGHMRSYSALPIMAMHALSPSVGTHDEQEELPYSELEAAAELQDYIQKTTNVELSDAERVVAHAPSFIKRLVAVIKQEAKEGKECADLPFSNQVCKFLGSADRNLLEAICESISNPHKQHPMLLVEQLPEGVNIESLLRLISTFEMLGVARNSIGNIISKHSEVLSYTSEEIKAGIRVIKGLDITEDENLSLIQRYPLICKSQTTKNIENLLEELEEFSSKKAIVRKAVCDIPQGVHTYRRGCATEVVDYLRSFEFTTERLNRIFQKYGRLVLADVDRKLKQNVQFLEDMGLSKDMIYKVINRCPSFLFYSVDDNLMSKWAYFKELGFVESEFCDVIRRYPNLFSASLEKKIKPAVAELRTLGLSNVGLKKVVLYRPSLFGYKLGGDISALVKQLNEGTCPEHKKVTAFIKLYSRGAEHKKRCEDCLVEHGLSIKEAKQVLEKEPGVLGYSEHALKDKLESLTNTLGIPIRAVLDVPEYLSFALRKRVQRRQRLISYLKSKGLLAAGALSLRQLVLHSNTQFYKDFVKSHSEDKELSKIWFRDRDSDCSVDDHKNGCEAISEVEACH